MNNKLKQEKEDRKNKTIEKIDKLAKQNNSSLLLCDYEARDIIDILNELNSIIKEVREYIEKEYAFTVDISGKKTTVVGYTKGINKMLEILNKVDKE